MRAERIGIGEPCFSSQNFSVSQIQLDAGLVNLSEEIQNPLNLAAMMSGALAYRGSHLFLSRLVSPLIAESGALTQALSQAFIKGASLFSEVGVFRTLSHQSFDIYQGQEFFTDAITFGTLKAFGNLVQSQNILLAHFCQSSGMVAAQNMAYGLGLALQPQGNLFQQLIQAEVTNLKLGLAMSLVHRALPLISKLEKSFELQNDIMRASRKIFLQSARNISALTALHSATPRVVLDAKGLEARLRDFTLERLSVDWRKGPPYELPPEVDTARTLQMAQGGERVRLNQSRLTPVELRDPKTRVLFSTAPESDFVRSFELDGESHRDLMFDVMGSMTGIANSAERTLHSVAPNYPRIFLEANLPKGRVRFESPKDMEDFQRSVLDCKPDLVLLSGLNVNTRVLLQMALFARQNGVKEVWLGGDAAIAPYKIIDQAFDRVIWGPAEEYLYHELVGDDFPGHRHPGVDQMRASVRWFVPSGENEVQEHLFDTLHLVLRMGCTQSCSYCAEGIKSNRGRNRPATSFDEAKALIDEAHEKGIRRVYFVDPDFGRLWDDHLEGKVTAYLHSKQMRWSCLTNVVTLQKHGDHMMENGLASVYLGMESFSPDHENIDTGSNRLRVLNRRWQDQQETVRQAERLRDNGVMVFGLYILFNPGETLEGIREGVRRLQTIVPLSQISTNQPFPGTAEFVTAVKEGYIFNFDPDYVRYGQMVWAPNGQVFDPDNVLREYVESHRSVNPLDRKGGFFATQRRFRERRRQP